MKREPDTSSSPSDDTLSVARLARRWRVGQDEVKRLLATDRLEFVQIRGVLRVPLSDIARYEKFDGPPKPRRLIRKNGDARRRD